MVSVYIRLGRGVLLRLCKAIDDAKGLWLYVCLSCAPDLCRLGVTLGLSLGLELLGKARGSGNSGDQPLGKDDCKMAL
ncbi:hypothetical protein SKAU_G00197370 [Synaphobranchus kaupii]|uniref:Uncharacterized protein n=1 Tax=Synaphobranchus kaupii TaxID=118154 RepID=A0A9Q1FEQ7_SYNKA|nr:hypothetical protein SKAU_G00197370 [Synaphobranchus kaupii]